MRLGFGLGLTARVAASVAAPTIASLYGTGLGSVPLHLDPATAVLDGNGYVVSIPNSGGAGAAFDVTKTGTGNITRSGNLLTVPTGPYLQLANAADMIGIRLFMVAALAPAAVGTPARLAGRFAGLPDGFRTEIHSAPANDAITYRRWNGATYEGVTAPLSGATGSTLRLIEVEILGGIARAWTDGTTSGSGVTLPSPWPNFFVDRIFAAQNTPQFTGLAGDILSLIVDGTAAQDAQVALIRSELAAKHGLTLA